MKHDKGELSLRLDLRKAQLAAAFLVFLLSAILSYFSVAGSGGSSQGQVNVCLTIDVSGSMNDVSGNVTKLSAAKSAASEFITILSQSGTGNFKAAIVSFSSNTTVVSTLTSNNMSLLSAVQPLVAWGSTALGDAIVTSVDLLSTQGGKSDIVLMTDGKSNAGTIQPNIAAEYAARHNIVVHAVAFGRDADDRTLRIIADETKGGYYFAASGSELVSVYQTIAKSYISPIMHYGSRALMLIALPLLLFLSEIQKGASTVYKTILSTVMKSETPISVGIRCPECGHDNRPAARFCASCRSALVKGIVRCSRCGKENRKGARFCKGCGTKLG